MVQLDLNPQERDILAKVLEVALSDLRYEISNTDSQDYRDVLKERKGVIIKTLSALGSNAA